MNISLWHTGTLCLYATWSTTGGWLFSVTVQRTEIESPLAVQQILCYLISSQPTLYHHVLFTIIRSSISCFEYYVYLYLYLFIGQNIILIHYIFYHTYFHISYTNRATYVIIITSHCTGMQSEDLKWYSGFIFINLYMLTIGRPLYQ